jgi:recombination protein RecA
MSRLKLGKKEKPVKATSKLNAKKATKKLSAKNSVKSALTKPPVKENERIDYLHSGSINLNLAASQKGKRGGWARGRIVNPVGDGSSGKTLCTLEAMANAFYTFKKQNDIPSYCFPKVKKLILVYDNVEGVMDFPIEEMYGEEFVEFVQWISSPTCEAAGRNIQRMLQSLKEGDCLIYAWDSLDSSVSSAQKERNLKSVKDDKDEDDAYGTEKAKYFSGAFFNNLCELQQGKDATVFMISQIRDNIGVRFGAKSKRAGGKALDFYTHQVPWLRTKDKLKKTFRSQDRVYGVRVEVDFKRNKCAKPFRQAEFTILFDYGMDDIGSMIDYLYGPKAKTIEWNEITYKREEFVDLIENDEEEYNKLVDEVEQDWKEIEAAVKPTRKSRWD